MKLTEAEREVSRRVDKMIARAVEKYGPEARSPGGHPEREVFDYAFNEMAGMVRYCDMMLARSEKMFSVNPILADRIKKSIERIREDCSHSAARILLIRDRLKDEGLLYGRAEPL